MRSLNVVAEPWKTLGFLASGEEFNPGPVTRLDHSELLCNKVLLKYQRDRESFWHRHRKGAERMSFLSTVMHAHIFSPGSLWAFFSGCLFFVTAITRASACSFVFFCLSFLHIPYHKRLSEPVATDYLNTDLAHTPVFIVYGTYLEPTEWEIYLLRSLSPLQFRDQSQWICEGLLSAYLGIYQELPSPPVLYLPI